MMTRRRAGPAGSHALALGEIGIGNTTAAAALVAAGLAADLKEGAAQGAEAIDSGRALQQVEKLAALTNQG